MSKARYEISDACLMPLGTGTPAIDEENHTY